VNSRKIEEFPRDNPGYGLSRDVSDFAARHHLWKPGDRLMVAVSGGADSVALLHILHELSPILELELTVVHLDHGLRGRSSREDARWVQSLAARMNIPCIAGRRDLRAEANESGRSPEEGARIARYEFFREALEKTGISTIALAHHADDQAETVLMKLLRGCGPAGLGGMRASRREGPLRIIRPLLSSRRWELREFLTSIGESFREDFSNRDCRFLRNRLRHELLPLLEQEYNPKIKEGLIHLAGMVREREDYLRDRLGDTFLQLFSKKEDEIEIDCERFSILSDFEQGEVLRHILWEAGVNGPCRSHFKDLKRLIAGPSGRSMDIAGGVKAFRRDDSLIINNGLSPCGPEHLTPLELTIPGEITVESLGAKITVRQDRRPQLIELNRAVDLNRYWENYPEIGELREYLDRDRVIEPIVARSRHPGDRYRPLLMPGSRKIKDILIDEKISNSIRDLIPVLEDAEGIIWLAGYRPAHRCRVRKNTKNILEISLIPV